MDIKLSREWIRSDFPPPKVGYRYSIEVLRHVIIRSRIFTQIIAGNFAGVRNMSHGVSLIKWNSFKNFSGKSLFTGRSHKVDYKVENWGSFTETADGSPDRFNYIVFRRKIICYSTRSGERYLYGRITFLSLELISVITWTLICALLSWRIEIFFVENWHYQFFKLFVLYPS